MLFNIYLLCKRCRRSDGDCLQEITVCGDAGLKNKHPSVKIERWGMTHLSRPLDPIRALLAVAYLVLRGVAPCFLAEAIHYGVEVPIRQIK